MKKHADITKYVLTGLILLCFISNVNSQTSYEKKFLKYFNSQSLAGKVKAFDTLPNDYKADCYPLVKEELKKIREKANYIIYPMSDMKSFIYTGVQIYSNQKEGTNKAWLVNESGAILLGN